MNAVCTAAHGSIIIAQDGASWSRPSSPRRRVARVIARSTVVAIGAPVRWLTSAISG